MKKMEIAWKEIFMMLVGCKVDMKTDFGITQVELRMALSEQ